MIDKDIFDFVKEGKGLGIPINTPDSKTLGIYLCNGPTNKLVAEEDACNQITHLNFTGPPGTASVLYYALTFMLSGGGWNVAKTDEWIEISPTFQEQYQKTVVSKRILEKDIKEGLTAAAASVADYELLEHDMRKYAQIMKMFAEKDEHSLRSMFIDQVDIHTGEGFSLFTMPKRWPTIITDFQSLEEDDVDIDKIVKKLKISKAEASILVTKNKLYKSWKTDFKDVVVKRYESLKGLARSKELSIEEYRKWLKPYISRYKMTRLGGESTAGRSEIFKSFADIAGSSTYTNGIQIWAWKTLKPAEVKHREIIKEGDFAIHPYDPWIRDNFILDEKKGLANLYPWLRNSRKYCIKCKKYHKGEINKCTCGGKLEKRTVADKIVEEDILPDWKAKEMSLNPSELYYSFFVIDVFRAGSKLPIGEIEDITFTVSSYAISQNIMLVKLLELKCREKEFEMYIDEILGLKIGDENIMDKVKEDFPALFEDETKKQSDLEKLGMDLRKISDDFGSFFKKMKVPKSGKLMFVKPGPYETDFSDRITKFYLNVNYKNFASVKDFLKSKMGVS